MLSNTCTLWDVYVQLYRRYGVTLPGGTCYGNFGVVTRFWFKGLPAAPERAYLVDIDWDWADINRDRFRHLVAGEVVSRRRLSHAWLVCVLLTFLS